MPKFLINLMLAFIPIQAWRKALRKKIRRKSLFGGLGDIFMEIKTKRDIVLAHKDSCNIIALGSSHGAYGFNPEFIGKNCFNLCTNSQDLYTAEKVLRYMLKKLPDLKKVILFVDVFSKGWSLENTSAEHICASYQYLYGIQYPLFNDKHNYLKQCKKLDLKKLIPGENKNGYLNPPKLNFTDSVEARVQAHLREHNRELCQYGHLKNIVSLMEHKDNLGGVFLVIPPYRSDYQKLLFDDLLSSEVKKLIDGTKAQLLDFSKDGDFSDKNFYDYDHLNPTGAEKFSKKLKELLND